MIFEKEEGKKTLLNTKYVFWFILLLLSVTFLILKRLVQDTVNQEMYTGLHIKHRLLFSTDFNGNCNLSTDIKKLLKYQIKICPVRAVLFHVESQMEGQTDRMKLSEESLFTILWPFQVWPILFPKKAVFFSFFIIFNRKPG